MNEWRAKVVAEGPPQELFSSGEAARWTKYRRRIDRTRPDTRDRDTSDVNQNIRNVRKRARWKILKISTNQQENQTEVKFGEPAIDLAPKCGGP